MKQFNELLEQYMEDNNLKMYDIVDDMEEHLPKLDAQFIENNDKEGYDSYGSEDSVLERIVFHTPTETYWKFSGTRQSYAGEEWNEEIKQVFQKQVQKTIYEETNS